MATGDVGDYNITDRKHKILFVMMLVQFRDALQFQGMMLHGLPNHHITFSKVLTSDANIEDRSDNIFDQIRDIANGLHAGSPVTCTCGRECMVAGCIDYRFPTFLYNHQSDNEFKKYRGYLQNT